MTMAADLCSPSDMYAQPYRGYAFIFLLRDREEAERLSRLLHSLRSHTTGPAAVFVVPEILGIDFFTHPDMQFALDKWWGQNIPLNSYPIYLIDHELGLQDWVNDAIDGHFYIGCASRGKLPSYTNNSRLNLIKGNRTIDYANQVISAFVPSNTSALQKGAVLFDYQWPINYGTSTSPERRPRVANRHRRPRGSEELFKATGTRRSKQRFRRAQLRTHDGLESDQFWTNDLVDLSGSKSPSAERNPESYDE